MPDLTYESLMLARTAKAGETEEFDLMKMANLALGILEQVNRIKGTGNNTMTSRPEGQGSAEAGNAIPQKPIIDVDQILGALGTVKELKGDIKITELEKLLKQHKDQVTALLGKL